MTIQKTLLVLAVLACASTGAVAAQTLTAFKTGEVTTGMTKQCVYDALGNVYTRTMASIAICPLNIQVRPPYASASVSPTVERPDPRTVTAFKTGEQTTGMTKQCFYNALGSAYTHSIGAAEICPLNIQVAISPR